MHGSCSLLAHTLKFIPNASIKGLAASSSLSPLTSSTVNPARLDGLMVGFMAAQMFIDVPPSIAVIVECFIVGIIVVRNFNPSIVNMSTQMHIRRYFGSIDAKGGWWWQSYFFVRPSCCFSRSVYFWRYFDVMWSYRAVENNVAFNRPLVLSRGKER